MKRDYSLTNLQNAILALEFERDHVSEFNHSHQPSYFARRLTELNRRITELPAKQAMVRLRGKSLGLRDRLSQERAA